MSPHLISKAIITKESAKIVPINKPRTELPIKKRVTFQYVPLIDHASTDPSTVLTAMIEAEKQTEIRGQKYTILTVDQQIFAIVLNIIWSDPNRWNMFVPRLGGMHFLMSFIGCIGSLMEGSGLLRRS